jgi:hypothetical protein
MLFNDYFVHGDFYHQFQGYHILIFLDSSFNCLFVFLDTGELKSGAISASVPAQKHFTSTVGVALQVAEEYDN